MALAQLKEAPLVRLSAMTCNASGGRAAPVLAASEGKILRPLFHFFSDHSAAK